MDLTIRFEFFTAATNENLVIFPLLSIDEDKVTPIRVDPFTSSDTFN